MAAWNGEFSEVEHRIKAGENPDTCGTCSASPFATNLTPLMVASHRGHTKIVELLISRGACVDLRDCFGRTALMLCVLNNHTSIALCLINNGACLDRQNNSGETALMCAAHTNHTPSALLLIHHGAKIDIHDNFGWTALLWGCIHGNPHIVAALLHHGALTDIKNTEGKTGLDFAKERNHTQCVDLIMRHLERVPEGPAQIDYARQQAGKRRLMCETGLSLRARCVRRCAFRLRAGDAQVHVALYRLPAHLQDEISAFSPPHSSLFVTFRRFFCW
eukprot:TRINITY_DN6214_c0_g1_i2.p1 TRINITY_DN6214_c0_g1~~TRINITY_DN6214_c0_g1_i2.p1  ORF type:complete len:275 (-),score=44.48 TRINITY_DN6214_c0_g1_i2:112-936(-)